MSQQELCQKSQEEVCEKKERKITTLPAKYLRYMSFAHWFLKELKLEEGVYNDLISKIPQDISQQISFLNPFIDFESLHQKDPLKLEFVFFALFQFLYLLQIR